jgi:ribonuclease P protein component
LHVSPVVSKKIAKKAVVRNLIKRRLRHLGRLYFSDGKIVVVAKRDLSGVEFQKLEEEFKKIVTKID